MLVPFQVAAEFEPGVQPYGGIDLSNSRRISDVSAAISGAARLRAAIV